MKIIRKHIAVLVIALLALSACEDLAFGDKFLQKPPSGDVTIDTIFSSAELARRVLWQSYGTLPYGLPTGYNFTSAMWYGLIEGLTDLNHSYLTWDGPNDVYYNGSYNPGNENNNQRKATKFRFRSRYNWFGIRHAWLFIENVSRVPDMDDAEKDRLTAEAKIIIATHYAEMMRHYGGLPIIDRAFEADETKLPARSTFEETVNFAVNLLNEAANTPSLPWTLPADEVNNFDGRLTRASAMALKVRILLFAASPLFNNATPYLEGSAADQKMTWYGNFDQGRWEAARQAADEFFQKVKQEGFYGLVKNTANYRLGFRDGYYTRGTSEALISVRRSYTAPDALMQSVRWGSSCATKEYFDMFPMADGSDFDWNNPVHAKNPFINRDPRMYETILVDGDFFGGTHLADICKEDPNDKANYPKGVDWAKKGILDPTSLSSGFPLRKLVLDRQGEYKGRVIHWPYLRMAEMYLSYAEALNECNETTKAYEYVNEVRNRVGLGNLKSGLNKEEMREAILRERACEFGWEEVRFFDLIRWKRANDFTKPLHGIDLFKHKTTKEYRIVIKRLKERAWQREGGFSSKWYLSAFPPEEIDKGYGMVQNPGWE